MRARCSGWITLPPPGEGNPSGLQPALLLLELLLLLLSGLSHRPGVKR